MLIFETITFSNSWCVTITAQGVFDDLLKVADETVKIIVDIDKETITRIFNIHYCDTAVSD